MRVAASVQRWGWRLAFRGRAMADGTVLHEDRLAETDIDRCDPEPRYSLQGDRDSENR